MIKHATAATLMEKRTGSFSLGTHSNNLRADVRFCSINLAHNSADSMGAPKILKLTVELEVWKQVNVAGNMELTLR